MMDTTHFDEAKALLDQINQSLAAYDPVLREKARDILLQRAFGQTQGQPSGATASQVRPAGAADVQGASEQVPSFDALLEKWTPTTQQDLALLGAYYFNFILKHESVSGFEINRVLKDHGRGSKNITQDLGAHIGAQPSLILQVKKAGSTKQGRKLYKITSPGIKYVEARLAPVAAGGE
jgi:hypothetical protein